MPLELPTIRQIRELQMQTWLEAEDELKFHSESTSLVL